jgi:ATP-binding protein involved in chromosome partitioning
MPLHIRTYHDLTEADRSGLGEQVGAQRRRVAERLAPVQRVVAVMSGKGGVGKSFVTAFLARALARAGRRVGALDADLNGPTLARLLDARGPLAVTAGAVEPVAGTDGVRCVSMAHVLEDGKPLAFKGPEGDAFIWRGALEAAALRELLGDVAWGALDVLLVDLPPGVGRLHELVDLLPKPPDVLTVTIPTRESADAVRRALHAARERGTRLLGVIENMAGPQFPGDAGDALAREFAIPLLARIPFSPQDAVWGELAARI